MVSMAIYRSCNYWPGVLAPTGQLVQLRALAKRDRQTAHPTTRRATVNLSTIPLMSDKSTLQCVI